MSARTFAATFLLAVLAAAAAGAQTAARELTIEQKFLRTIEMQILKEQAADSSHESKMLALDALERKVAGGSLGDVTDDVEYVLEYLALEGTGRINREGHRQVNYFPDVRRRAAELLGKVRTAESKDALIFVLLNDDEPMVTAQAAWSLGELGMNDDNDVIAALVYAVETTDHTRPDNNWGFAMVLAFEKLDQKLGGLRDPGAFRALVKISQGNYLATVRQKALAVLEAMKS